MSEVAVRIATRQRRFRRGRALVVGAVLALSFTTPLAVASEGQQQSGPFGLFPQQQQAHESESSSAGAAAGDCDGAAQAESHGAEGSSGGQQQTGTLGLYGQQQQGGAASSSGSDADGCSSSTHGSSDADSGQQQSAALGQHRQEQGGDSSAGSEGTAGCEGEGASAGSTESAASSSGQQQGGFLGLSPQQQYENESGASSDTASACGDGNAGERDADADASGGQQQAGLLGTSETSDESPDHSCTAGAVEVAGRACVVGGQQQDAATGHQQQCAVGSVQRDGSTGQEQFCVLGAQQQGAADGEYQDSCLVLGRQSEASRSCSAGEQRQDSSGQRATAPGAQQQGDSGQQQSGLLGNQQQGSAGQQQSGLLGLYHQQQRPDRAEEAAPELMVQASRSAAPLPATVPTEPGAKTTGSQPARADDSTTRAPMEPRPEVPAPAAGAPIEPISETDSSRQRPASAEASGGGSAIGALLALAFVLLTFGYQFRRHGRARPTEAMTTAGADEMRNKWTKALGAAALAIMTVGVFTVAWSSPGGGRDAREPVARPSAEQAPTDAPTRSPVAPVEGEAAMVEPADRVRAAVQAALAENGRLSRQVLWTNEVPGWATDSTRGPALESLRRAAEVRRSQDVRVEVEPSEPEILRIEPGDGEVVAVARLTSDATVHRGGSATQQVTSTETVEIVLREVTPEPSYVVWEVTPVGSDGGVDPAPDHAPEEQDPPDLAAPASDASDDGVSDASPPDAGGGDDGNQVVNNNNNDNDDQPTGDGDGASAATTSDGCSSGASASAGGSSASACGGGGG